MVRVERSGVIEPLVATIKEEDVGHAPRQWEIELSVAISLKRIADTFANIEVVVCNPLVTIEGHPQA